MNLKTFHTIVIAVTVFLLPVSGFGQSAWSAFQNGGDLNDADRSLPTQWSSASKDLAWVADLAGYGQSSPVVFDGTVYVTSVTGENKETLNIQALSAKDGKQKWIFNRANSSPEKNTVMVSRAAPSPVADAQGVVAFFEGGNLVALNPEGQLRWQRDLKAEFGGLQARHGLAASLEQDEQHIYLWAERMEAPYVMAISKQDGKTVWKQPGVGGTSWSSPRLVPVGKEKHLVLSGMGVIVGLDPATGNRKWEFRKVTGNSSSTPVPVGDGKFLMGSIGGRSDSDTTPSCGVIQVSKADQGYTVSWLWNAPRASCSFGSPFAVDGRAYFVNRSGILYCHDLDSGKNLYTSRLPAGQIWATPLASNDLIYFFGKSGTTSIVKPGDQLELVAENQLWEVTPEPADSAAGPASQFSGGVLYAAVHSDDGLFLRRGDRLYAVRNP